MILVFYACGRRLRQKRLKYFHQSSLLQTKEQNIGDLKAKASPLFAVFMFIYVYLSVLQLPLHERQTLDRSPCTLTLTPRFNLETPINPPCMFSDGGKKPKYRERTHTYTKRTCKLHRERPKVEI